MHSASLSGALPIACLRSASVFCNHLNSSLFSSYLCALITSVSTSHNNNMSKLLDSLLAPSVDYEFLRDKDSAFNHISLLTVIIPLLSKFRADLYGLFLPLVGWSMSSLSSLGLGIFALIIIFLLECRACVIHFSFLGLCIVFSYQ